MNKVIAIALYLIFFALVGIMLALFGIMDAIPRRITTP